MKLQITADNLPLRGTVENLIGKHLSKDLEKYVKSLPKGSLKADVRVIKRARWGYKATFSMVLPKNHKIYSEEVHGELSTALTKLRDEVKRQLKRYKSRVKKST